MRTTVSIDDQLLGEAKAIAARSGRTLGEVIDDALRLMLVERNDRKPRRLIELATYGGSGLQPGVDLEDRELLAEMQGDNRVPGSGR